jgi:hypothetical protein
MIFSAFARGGTSGAFTSDRRAIGARDAVAITSRKVIGMER